MFILSKKFFVNSYKSTADSFLKPFLKPFFKSLLDSTKTALLYKTTLLELGLFTIKVSIFRRIALVLLGDEESC